MASTMECSVKYPPREDTETECVSITINRKRRRDDSYSKRKRTKKVEEKVVRVATEFAYHCGVWVDSDARKVCDCGTAFVGSGDECARCR